MGWVNCFGSLVALLVATSQLAAGMQVLVGERQAQEASKMVGLRAEAKARPAADQLRTSMDRASAAFADQVASAGKRLEALGTEERQAMARLMGAGFRPENITDATSFLYDEAFAAKAMEINTKARPRLTDKVQLVTAAARRDPEMGDLAARLGRYVAAAGREVTQMGYKNLEEALPHVAEFTQRLQRDLETGSQRPLVESLIQKVALAAPAQFDERGHQALEADQSALECTEKLMDLLAICNRLDNPSEMEGRGRKEQSCRRARAACEKEGRLYGTKMNISWDVAPAVCIGQWPKHGTSGFYWELRFSPKFGGMVYEEGMFAGDDPFFLRAGMRNKVDIGWQFADGTKIYAGAFPELVCEKGKKKCTMPSHEDKKFFAISHEDKDGRIFTGKFDRWGGVNRAIAGVWWPWEAYNRSDPEGVTHDTYLFAYVQPATIIHHDNSMAFIGAQGGSMWMDSDWSEPAPWWCQFTIVRIPFKENSRSYFGGMVNFDEWGWSLEGHFGWKSKDFFSEETFGLDWEEEKARHSGAPMPETGNIPSMAHASPTI